MDTCQKEHLDRLAKHIIRKMWQDNGLMMLNAILMGVVVFVGAYAPRYRYYPLIRFLFHGGTTLFLPIVTTILDTATNLSASGAKYDNQFVVAECTARHTSTVLIWTGLVIIIIISTSTVVAADPREKKRKIIPLDLFLKPIWIAYIIISITSSDKLFRTAIPQVDPIFIPLFVLTFSKLGLRCSAYFIARRSDALGQNPKLIARHMAQLGNLEHVDLHMHAPALVVKGEDTAIVEKRPHGHRLESMSRRLVTLDKVWELDDRLMTPEAKDLCFSFSLFKLLRCQFARYTISKPSLRRVQTFFRGTYLEGDNHERVVRVVADELSFIHDYYNSSLPTSYSNQLFPFMNIFLSFLSICYCSYMFVFVSRESRPLRTNGQITCIMWCAEQGARKGVPITGLRFGSPYFDIVPAYLVIALLMLSETRDIVVYICSNWTKIAFISSYTMHPSWHKSSSVQKCIGFVFKRCRCRLTKNWEGTLNQCSIFVGSRNKMHQCSMFVLTRLLRLSIVTNRKKTVLTNAVKKSVFKALKCKMREQEGVIEHIQPPSISEVNVPINGNGKCIAETLLAWHMATSIFEAKHPWQPNANYTAATQLSRYCTYLVACHPQLLPGEEDKLYKSLFKTVKKDAERILADQPKCTSPGEKYNMLFNKLTHQLRKDTPHEVLKDGVTIAEELDKKDKRYVWEELADFWSNMILYLAPSGSLDAHAEAIARGGELITLLWALLAHQGIDAAAAATTGDHV